jgi:uncharacterized membrane protein
VDWKARFPILAAALWWGSLTAIGFVAIPLLFANLATPAIAGQMAAKLFTAQAWISILCGLMVLIAQRRPNPLVLVGLLLALLGEFAVAPRIVARQDLALWHTVGTVFYGLQWLCALVALWKLSARSS